MEKKYRFGSPRRPPFTLDTTDAPREPGDDHPRFPLTIFMKWTHLNETARVRHVRLHSSWGKRELGFVTVHRFWLWADLGPESLVRDNNLVSGPHFFAEGTQRSVWRDRPPSDRIPIEIEHLYKRIRRGGCRLEIFDYVTDQRIPYDRELDGPLPAAEDFTRVESHAPRARKAEQIWGWQGRRGVTR